MKNFIFNIILCVVLCSSYNVLAQNTPNTSGLSGTITGSVAYPKNFNQSPNVAPTSFNIVREYVPLVPMTSIPAFNSTINSRIKMTTTYMGGTHLPLMTVECNGNSKDIVTVSDNRSSATTISYLQYPADYHTKFQNNAFTQQKDYYNNKYPAEGATAYTKCIVATSQGMPVVKRYREGKGSVGLEHGALTKSNINSGSEVSKLSYSGGNLCENGTYPAGKLVIERIEGAHGDVTLTFRNRAKQLLCKKVYDGNTGNNGWLTTYYVYNDKGKLVVIVPPKASMQLNGTTNCLSDIDKLCYTYEYDDFDRILTKTTPGKDGFDRVIYDKLGQTVLSQTPLMEQYDKWGFSIFDKQGRVVVTGIYSGSLNGSYWTNIASGAITASTNTNTLEYWIANGVSNYDYPANLDDCEIQSFNYYDNYAYGPGNGITFDNSFSADYLTGGTDIVVPIAYMFTQGKLVASKVRVLENGQSNNFMNTPWITSVYFYSEKGQLIQTKTLNPWNNSNWDVTTNQYNFAGQKILDITKHYSSQFSNKNQTIIRNKYVYGSKTGWLESVQQKLDNDNWRTISSMEYDDLGRVKRKWLGEVEMQDITYDIHSVAVGLNSNKLWDTATLNPVITYWEEISYETGFDNPRFDGSISGFKWRSASSRVSAYGYSYDNVNRMIKADYRDFSKIGTSSPSWNKTNRDFSVSDISFDANGNLKTLKQRGYNNSFAPADIDILSYEYDEGNRLLKVEEDPSSVSSLIHDFENGNSGSTDYGYDVDGNLAADLNKGIDLITYNHMDLPLQVSKGPDNINNIYDASGALLQKKIFETGQNTIYQYWGPFVYRNDSLLYINHPEGRTRYMVDSGFRYDYFVKDHLGNVRTVVTADVYNDSLEYDASFELLAANWEEQLFEHIGEIRTTKPDASPIDLMSGVLDGSFPDKRIGAALLVHAMAGDQLNLNAYGYYESYDSSDQNTYATPQAMVNSLVGVLGGGVLIPGGEGGGLSTTQIINNLFSTGNYNVYDALKQSVTDPAYPRVYLNYLVFSEDMAFRPEQSKVVQLTGGPGIWLEMTIPGNLIMDANGYLCIYLSNESGVPAYVDNMHFAQYKGRLLEEQLYYPHGLLVELGGQQNTPLPNDILHQSKKLQKELGLELYDFHARQYDPQIGRFWGIDPADQYPSGYTGMGNDPANMIDPSGMMAQTSNYYGGINVKFKLSRIQAEYEFYHRNDAELAIIAHREFIEMTGVKVLQAASEAFEALAPGSASHGDIYRMSRNINQIIQARTGGGYGDVGTPAFAALQMGLSIMKGVAEGRLDPSAMAAARLIIYESGAEGLLSASECATLGLQDRFSANAEDNGFGIDVKNNNGEGYSDEVVTPGGGEERSWNDVNTNALKKFIAITVGESGIDFNESAGIGSVMLNRMDAAGTSLANEDFSDDIGGKEELQAIDGPKYRLIMNMSWAQINSPSNLYAIPISGAIAAVASHMIGMDLSNGAYFWNASTSTTGFNWRAYNRGIFVKTMEAGSTTFFRYKNTDKTWP